MSKSKFFERQEKVICSIEISFNIRRKKKKRNFILKQKRKLKQNVLFLQYFAKLFNVIMTSLHVLDYMSSNILINRDNIRRIQNKKILEQMREIELNKQRIPSKEKSYYSPKSRTVEDLHLDYKKKQNKLKLLKKSVDLEQGLTFKPNIRSTTNSINVRTSFEERNSKVIEYRKRLNELGNSPQLYNIKKYTSSEIEENNKRIVERLYQRDLEKILSKNYRLNENQYTTEGVAQGNISNETHMNEKRLDNFNNTDELTFHMQNKNNENNQDYKFDENEDEGNFQEYENNVGNSEEN